MGCIRAAYLDLMRDSLIGRLNQDPPLPACKIEGYRDEFRENGWDWPSKAPSMIGAKRMNNIRSECERVITLISLATSVRGTAAAVSRRCGRRSVGVPHL